MAGALAAVMLDSMNSHRSPSVIGTALPKEQVLRMGAQAKLFALQRAATEQAIERQAALRARLERTLVPQSSELSPAGYPP